MHTRGLRVVVAIGMAVASLCLLLTISGQLILPESWWPLLLPQDSWYDE